MLHSRTPRNTSSTALNPFDRGDYLAATLLIVAPFALNFRDSDPGLSVFYIVAGVAVLAVSLVTNYQYSDKRDWTPQATVA